VGPAGKHLTRVAATIGSRNGLESGRHCSLRKSLVKSVTERRSQSAAKADERAWEPQGSLKLLVEAWAVARCRFLNEPFWRRPLSALVPSERLRRHSEQACPLAE
jgi:hypothetical protein